MASASCYYGKKLLFSTVTALILFAFLEWISYAGLASILSTSEVRERIHQQQARGVRKWGYLGFAEPFDSGVDAERLHPYFGYVLRGKTPEDAYGFGNPISPFQKRSNDKVILAVVGGSVAHEMFNAAIQDLTSELGKVKKFEGKEIIPVNLALSGYKQPQQLMVINYFLSMGGEFNIVINIDGFNEATMPIVENRPVKVPSVYPRDWRARVDPLEPWAIKNFMGKRVLTILRYKARYFFQQHPLADSYTAMLLWKVADRVLGFGMSHFQQRYLYEMPKREIEKIGPFREDVSGYSLYNYLADIWKFSSKGIQASANMNDFDYFHFLQPNLHFEGTKIWSRMEMSLRRKSNIYQESVNKVYPLIQSRGKELLSGGEKFYDLSRVFEKYADTVYLDNCCHLRRKGSAILAKTIGRMIVTEYERTPGEKQLPSAIEASPISRW